MWEGYESTEPELRQLLTLETKHLTLNILELNQTGILWALYHAHYLERGRTSFYLEREKLVARHFYSLTCRIFKVSF